MPKVIECTCGFVIRADRDEDLIAQAQRHAREAHHVEIPADQVLAMARPA